MSQYKASGYINGHDHCSGYYFDDHMAFVLTGAGMECCYAADNLNNKANPGEPWFRMDKGQNQGDGGGFASFTVTQPPRTAAGCLLSAPHSLPSSSTLAAVPSATEPAPFPPDFTGEFDRHADPIPQGLYRRGPV